jgi:hypothetical protein
MIPRWLQSVTMFTESRFRGEEGECCRTAVRISRRLSLRICGDGLCTVALALHGPGVAVAILIHRAAHYHAVPATLFGALFAKERATITRLLGVWRCVGVMQRTAKALGRRVSASDSRLRSCHDQRDQRECRSDSRSRTQNIATFLLHRFSSTSNLYAQKE